MVDITSLIQTYPRITIIVFSLLISFFISLVNYFVLDKERMAEIKAKQKKVQEQIKDHQKAGEHQKALALQKELFTDMPEMMKHSMKPMLITFVPIIVVFALIRGVYAETSIASSWFWYYFFTAIIGSLIFRKLLKLP
jgi:uncharacterized membrane protein (DUF106 family)